MSYDPGDVTLAERPGLLIGLLRDELDRGVESDGDTVDRERQEALSEARAKTRHRDRGRAERFETLWRSPPAPTRSARTTSSSSTAYPAG